MKAIPRLLALLGFLMVSATLSKAQTMRLRDPAPFYLKFKYARPSLSVSLHGYQVFRPGLTIGLEQPIWELRKEKVKPRSNIDFGF